MNKKLVGVLGSAVVIGFVMLAGLFMAGTTTVDATEHCVLTRFGRVKQERMDTGFHFTPLSEATCFTLTESNFPKTGEAETMEAQTNNPVTITGDVAVIYAYDPDNVFQVFLDKRSQDAAEIVIRNSIREGYRTAIAGWSVDDIFSSRRRELSDSVHAHITDKLGGLARIETVFVRNIRTPQAIEDARVAAVRQDQVLDSIRTQFTIDSVRSASALLVARNSAAAAEAEGLAYQSNGALLNLRIAEEMANGLAQVCRGVSVCVVGGSVMDTWANATGIPRR